jgi:hypothetical protein
MRTRKAAGLAVACVGPDVPTSRPMQPAGTCPSATGWIGPAVDSPRGPEDRLPRGQYPRRHGHGLAFVAAIRHAGRGAFAVAALRARNAPLLRAAGIADRSMEPFAPCQGRACRPPPKTPTGTPKATGRAPEHRVSIRAGGVGLSPLSARLSRRSRPEQDRSRRPREPFGVDFGLMFAQASVGRACFLGPPRTPCRLALQPPAAAIARRAPVSQSCR